jgi:hypothetical protein
MRSIYFSATIKRVLLAFIVSLFICIAGFAQVSFVQITDPHLYDDGQDAAENKRALIDCVTKIDTMLSEGADYKFVDITGDIGIGKLIKPLIEQKEKAPNAEEVDRIRRAIDSRITEAALDVANVLAPSRIKVWLSLPGNNDLIDEKPDTINYYREFIKQLRTAYQARKSLIFALS